MKARKPCNNKYAWSFPKTKIYFVVLSPSYTLYYGALVAQSLEQAPFTSEIVGSILATDSCGKSLSTLC
jgi:hypothetical protein